MYFSLNYPNRAVIIKIMNKAIFFDRDGTLIKEKHYINSADDVEIISGVEEVFSFYNELGYKIFIISNQSGIARGKITTSQYTEVDKKTRSLITNGDLIVDSFYCPHHPDITGDCNCRKPNTGMLLEAKEKYDIDLTQSIIVGDKISDVKLVETANLAKGFLVKTGHGLEELQKNITLPQGVEVVDSIKNILEIETISMEKINE